VWRAVGGFDERFFLIFEDADWSMRARARGVDLIVDPSVHIDHAVSASFTGGRALLGLYYYARNGLLFAGRWRRHTGRGDRGTAARLLRRHVLPEVTGAWRRGDLRGALDRQAVLAVALAHQAAGRYGRAPDWLERQVAQRTRASMRR
jgi:GT2 family glycosyltransferase